MCGGKGVKENGKLFCCCQDNGLRLQTFHLVENYFIYFSKIHQLE